MYSKNKNKDLELSHRNLKRTGLYQTINAAWLCLINWSRTTKYISSQRIQCRCWYVHWWKCRNCFKLLILQSRLHGLCALNPWPLSKTSKCTICCIHTCCQCAKEWMWTLGHCGRTWPLLMGCTLYRLSYWGPPEMWNTLTLTVCPATAIINPEG